MNPSLQRFRLNICKIFSSMLSEWVRLSAYLEFIIYSINSQQERNDLP